MQLTKMNGGNAAGIFAGPMIFILLFFAAALGVGFFIPQIIEIGKADADIRTEHRCPTCPDPAGGTRSQVGPPGFEPAIQRRTERSIGRSQHLDQFPKLFVPRRDPETDFTSAEIYPQPRCANAPENRLAH